MSLNIQNNQQLNFKNENFLEGRIKIIKNETKQQFRKFQFSNNSSASKSSNPPSMRKTRNQTKNNNNKSNLINQNPRFINESDQMFDYSISSSECDEEDYDMSQFEQERKIIKLEKNFYQQFKKQEGENSEDEIINKQLNQVQQEKEIQQQYENNQFQKQEQGCKKKKLVLDDEEEYSEEQNNQQENPNKTPQRSRKESEHKKQANSSTPIRSFKRLKRKKKQQIQHLNSQSSYNPEQASCPICISNPEDGIFGKVKCNHNFCFSCIYDWAQVTNICPVCRGEFFQIEKSDGSLVKVQPKRQRMPDQELDPQDMDDLNDFVENDMLEAFCYKCNTDQNTSELLICDKCDIKICHVGCDETILDGRIPDGEWFCHYCRELESDDDDSDY